MRPDGDSQCRNSLETPLTQSLGEPEILVLEKGIVFEPPDTAPSQGEQHTVVIAYLFQASLDCSHCGEKFNGMHLENYVDHLESVHSNVSHTWMFLCALCAHHLQTEEEILEHMSDSHVSELSRLPREAIKQGRDQLIPLVCKEGENEVEEPDETPMLPEEAPTQLPEETSPQDSLVEEEVPPCHPLYLVCQRGQTCQQDRLTHLQLALHPAICHSIPLSLMHLGQTHLSDRPQQRTELPEPRRIVQNRGGRRRRRCTKS